MTIPGWLDIKEKYTENLEFHETIFVVTTVPSATRSLQWRYNECDDVSNHQCLNCLLKRLFRRRSMKTSKAHVNGGIPLTKGQ